MKTNTTQNAAIITGIILLAVVAASYGGLFATTSTPTPTPTLPTQEICYRNVTIHYTGDESTTSDVWTYGVGGTGNTAGFASVESAKQYTDVMIDEYDHIYSQCDAPTVPAPTPTAPAPTPTPPMPTPPPADDDWRQTYAIFGGIAVFLSLLYFAYRKKGGK